MGEGAVMTTMLVDPHAMSMARDNLAQRIARVLDRLEDEGRDPNRLEGDLLLDALSHLAALQLPTVKELVATIEQACLAAAQNLFSVRPPYDPVTAKSLRLALQHILARTNAANIVRL
jgi:hypothetical protein